MRYLTSLLLLLPLTAVSEQNLRILLTNDDGFESPGITALREALNQAGHDVYVIAPATQQSGASASVTASGVGVTAHPNQTWAVHGRPADAVRVGLGNIMYNNPPDLVVSGANFGQNTGQDVNVSGTVGAALTAYRLGTPAIAVSVEIKLNELERGFPSTVGAFKGAARLVARLISNLKLDDMTAVLNVNYPARLPLDVRGVRWSALSDHSVFANRYNLNAEGTYVPEFQGPRKNARERDAESLIDGFVTLTFLDGDISTPTRRGQKYLDKHLLDRAYEPVAPASRKAVLEPSAEPKTVTSDPEPQPEPNVLNERKPVEPVIQLPETHAEPTSPDPKAVSMPVDTEEENAVVEETTEQPDEPKKKPDSWLRRMFNPSSWGN